MRNYSPDALKILFGVTSPQSLTLLGRLPKAMVEVGWNVHVVAGTFDRVIPESLVGLSLHSIPMPRNPSPVRDSYSLVKWIRLLRKVKPDVVVIGTPKASFLGIIASFICRVPIRIYQLRGLRLETVSGALRRLLTIFEWLTALSSTEVLAVSASLKREYCLLGLAPEKKVQVLGFGSSHGVDIQLFHPDGKSEWELFAPHDKQDVGSTGPVLGFVGRFSRDKGSRELIACSNNLTKSGLPHTLLLIGPVEGDGEALRDLDPRTSQVLEIGPVEDVAPYYSMMDLLVLPTHREGFPNAVLEAAASGVPAVTTDATGAVDSVIDGQTGYVVPARDDYALAEAVKTLVQDAELRYELGKNARAWVATHFDSALVTKAHVDYLVSKAEALLQRRRGA